MGQLQYISTTNGAFDSILAQNVTQDSVIEAKFLSTDYSNIVAFGVDSADMRVRHWWGDDDMYWYDGGGFVVTSLWTLNEEHTVSFSTSEYKWDGVKVHDVSGTCNIPSTPKFVPVVNGRLYYFKITDNGVDKVNLVAWDENGVLGMKDLVSGIFYQPSEGTWTAGPAYSDNNIIPINKYKLYTSNIQKTYNGSTQINKMYVGNDLVYRAVPTTTGPQLVMPLNEVWYKTADDNSFAPKSGTYYIDSNGNQLTYTESFDSVSGLWKMVFNGNVYGNVGSLYYNMGQTNRLLELWLPYGFVRPTDIFIYGQDTFEKFKGDSPAIVDNGNAVVCLVQDSTNTKDFVMQSVKNATTVTIPEGIIGLGGYAFYKLTATTVNLPSTISKLDYASCERTNITTLNCYATTAPTVDSMAWYMVGNNGTLHYPAGSDYSNFTVPSSWTKVGDL